MAARGVRDEMVLIGKGAHSPLVYPDVIGRQLTESLDRLKTGHIEIYFMHRDNPAVPVGEFVDAMDAEVSAGRIGIYGGSNWTRERMDAAFAYAEKNGRRLPGALSNNFSLAEMVNPVWAGRARGLRRRLEGLAPPAANPDLRLVEPGARLLHRPRRARQADDPELVNAWYSDKNFARRDRAIELGQAPRQEPAARRARLLPGAGFPGHPDHRAARRERARRFARGTRHRR